VPLGCPSESELLLVALADDRALNPVIVRHLSGCSACQARVVDLRRVVSGVRASAATGVAPDGECLDPVALAQLLDGDVLPGQREAGIAHLAACGQCRSRLASLTELLADPDVAAELVQIDPVPERLAPRRRLWGAGLVAAAAAVLVLVWTGTRELATGEHRGPTITATVAPTPMSPIGDVSDATTLTWTAVAGADRYRVTLFAATGSVLFETQLTDTMTVLPDSIIISPGQLYLWKVEARTGWDRWASSELMEFRVGPGTAPQLPLMPTPSRDLPVAQPPSQDSLRLLARRLSDSALALEIRARPLEVREALTQTLALAVRGHAAGELGVAHRLAAAYASAWHDPFLIHEVARFTAWPPQRREAKVQADSLRRAGVAAYGGDGATAAIVIWRRALTGATTIADTAGMAAILGNIGAGLSQDGQLDARRSTSSAPASWPWPWATCVSRPTPAPSWPGYASSGTSSALVGTTPARLPFGSESVIPGDRPRTITTSPGWPGRPGTWTRRAACWKPRW
jgi:hypothetical protein